MTVAPRLAAALADRYRIEREIGSGGMATVYLAHDVRHERKVAIKVLRPELAAVIGSDRFLAEIKTTAHLQHPHILGLIDSGEVDGTVFYVMPYVAGESLRERLQRELQLPIPDAVRIATQVAGALDYAHRHGVIHRDIKPANILLHDQQALVADFGIALAVTRRADTHRMTDTGMSVGTPHYMSPEQAMGERTLDARTDVYALGCVLYEMLTGEPPFNGPSAQAIIAKLMSVDPEPVTTLRRSVPPNVAAATMVALQKVPADRFATAADFAAALNNPQFVAPQLHITGGTRIPRTIRREWLMAAAIAVVAAIGAAGWLRSARPAELIAAHFEIAAEESMTGGPILLSGDGTRLIWSGSGAYWERRLDTLGARRLRDAPGLQSPIRAISPDGRSALISSGRGGGPGGPAGPGGGPGGPGGGLAIVPLAGGPARMLASGGGRGATWGADGNIYFALGGSQARVVARISADSGRVDTLAALPDSARIGDEIVVLPGGHGLVAALDRNGTFELQALDFRTKSWHALTAGGPQVRYVAPGYLVYVNGQNIMAAPFDAGSLRLSAAPQTFVETGATVDALAASAQVLAYRAGPEGLGVGIELRSANGNSRLLDNVPDTIQFSLFAGAPDGRRFAALGTPVSRSGRVAGQALSSLYVYTLPTGPLTRLSANALDMYPAWIPPAGRELSFVRFSARDSSTLMRRTWDGSSEPVPIVTHTGRGDYFSAHSWLPSGIEAIVQVGGRGIGGGPGGGRGRGGPPPSSAGGRTGSPGQTPGAAPANQSPDRGGRGGGPFPSTGDLMRLVLAAPDTLRRVVATDSVESSPAVSPDGRLLAYVSNSSGQNEVYVGPIDGSERRQVSLNGGGTPRWARSGHQLFFRAQNLPGTPGAADTVYAATIERGADLTVGEIHPVLIGTNLQYGFAVLPGDTLFVTRASASDTRRSFPPVTVMLNFVHELDRLFGRK